MSQPQQIIFVTPSADWDAVDNAASPSFPTLSTGTHLGYDTKTGAVDQGINLFGSTGTTTLDTSGNDQSTPDPQIATFPGNPVAATPPTYKTVTTVINNALTGVRVLWKNPAVVIF